MVYRALSGGDLDQVNPSARYPQTVNRFPLNISGGSSPESIAVAADGKLWVSVGSSSAASKASNEQAVLVFNPTTHVIEHRYPLGPNGFDPFAISFDNTGNLWIAERNASQVEEMDSTGRILQSIPLSASAKGVAANPFSLTQGADGNIWVADINQAVIWKITPAGAASVAHAFASNCVPAFILPASSNSLWFSDYGCGKVGQITMSGQVTEEASTSPNAAPDRLAVGPDHNLWFSDIYANQIFQYIP